MNREQLIKQATLYCVTESVSCAEWRALATNMIAQMQQDAARIDALMLEFCPGRMDADQIVRWARNQEPVIRPACSNE